MNTYKFPHPLISGPTGNVLRTKESREKTHIHVQCSGNLYTNCVPHAIAIGCETIHLLNLDDLTKKIVGMAAIKRHVTVNYCHDFFLR